MLNDPPRSEKVRKRLTDGRAVARILGSAQTAPVRALAYADGRRAVRMAFLAGAAANRYLEALPATSDEIAERFAVTNQERLDAWLRVGIELGELSVESEQISVTGRRARAIAKNDAVVSPFYRSIGEYYFGPHLELAELVGGHPGRDDLSRSASTISEVSRVAAALSEGTLSEVVAEIQPETWLEIGCGSGVHLLPILLENPELRAVAIDLDADVIEDATKRFADAGVSDRVRCLVGDALDVVGDDDEFDVVTLLNNIYYFPVETRPELIDRLSRVVRAGGELVVASQCVGSPGEQGSIAAAQLDFLLRVQRDADASLPTKSELVELMSESAGVELADIHQPLPNEPYFVLRAKVRQA